MTTQAIADELVAELGFEVNDYTIVVSGDAMAPGLSSGDLAVVRPVNGYDGEGVYLVNFDGLETLRRIYQTADSKYTSRCDNQLHYPGDYAVPQDCLVGRVIATVSRV
jgi:phage repressor protein C with HTH and peptisase S24 domain